MLRGYGPGWLSAVAYLWDMVGMTSLQEEQGQEWVRTLLMAG